MKRVLENNSKDNHKKGKAAQQNIEGTSNSNSNLDNSIGNINLELENYTSLKAFFANLKHNLPQVKIILKAAYYQNPNLALDSLAFKNLILVVYELLIPQDKEFIKLFKNTMPQVNQDHKIWYHLGIAQKGREKLIEAEDSFQKAILLNDSVAEYFLELGQITITQRSPLEAIEYLKQAIKLGPHDANNYHAIGVAYSLEGNYRQALVSFETAIELDKGNPLFYINKGKVLQKLGDESAETQLYFVLAQDWGDQNIFIELGKVWYEYFGNKQNAELCFKQAIEIDPKDFVTYKNVGLAYRDIGDQDKAMECLNKAQKLNPEDDEIYYYLALAHGAQGDFLKYFEKAIAINGSKSEYHFQAGIACLKVQQLQKAIDYFSAAIVIDQNNIEYYFQRGEVLYNDGRAQKAAFDFRQAIERTSNKLLTTLSKGYMAILKEEYREATKIFKSILEDDPENPRAILELSKLELKLELKNHGKQDLSPSDIAESTQHYVQQDETLSGELVLAGSSSKEEIDD